MRHAVVPALGAATFALFIALPARAQMKMDMPESPAHFAPTHAVYSSDHAFLIKLVSVPKPIPFEKYFTVKFAVYSGHDPHHRLSDASIKIFAGMRHGMTHGFAHGMESSPKITKKDGVFTVSGMYFHMMGPWVVKIWVNDGARHDIVYFKLPCCGE